MSQANTILTKNRCLVLNKNWAPVGTVSLQRAIVMIFGEKARIIDHESYATFTWDDWSKIRPNMTDEKIKSANIAFKVPEIILLNHYDRIPSPKVHFSRRNLFKRDGMKCQYCGCKPGSNELTVDHIIPSSIGGKSTWENCVLACVDCNGRKANRTPEQANMKLRKKPKKPHFNMRFSTLKRVKSWETFLGTMYWNVSIEDD